MRAKHSTLANKLGCDVPFLGYTVKFAGRAATAVAGLLIASVILPVQADEIYKSVDAQGNVVYSDRPTTIGAKKAAVAVQQADPHEADRLAKERLLLKAEDDQRTRTETRDNQIKAQQDARKKQACDAARQHYNDLNAANRLYKSDANGNREFYTDAQADALRNEAKRKMDAACGS